MPRAYEFPVSSDFVFKLTAENDGQGTARNVVIEATLSNANVRFVGEAQLFVSTTGENGDWGAAVQTQTLTDFTDFVTFDPIDVDGVAGDNHVRVVFQARATGDAEGDVVDMITTLDYGNAPPGQDEWLPLAVVQTTTIVR